MKSKGDKTSEVGKPDNPNYDEDSINSGYKKDKNNRDSDDSDNEEEKENKEINLCVLNVKKYVI